jgi:N-ethylmaleimide reductase
MSVTKALAKPLQVGKFALKHRVVLAPLTRCRSDDRLAPRQMNVEYYRQRATDGLFFID